MNCLSFVQPIHTNTALIVCVCGLRLETKHTRYFNASCAFRRFFNSISHCLSVCRYASLLFTNFIEIINSIQLKIRTIHMQNNRLHSMSKLQLDFIFNGLELFVITFILLFRFLLLIIFLSLVFFSCLNINGHICETIRPTKSNNTSKLICVDIYPINKKNLKQ